MEGVCGTDRGVSEKNSVQQTMNVQSKTIFQRNNGEVDQINYTSDTGYQLNLHIACLVSYGCLCAFESGGGRE